MFFYTQVSLECPYLYARSYSESLKICEAYNFVDTVVVVVFSKLPYRPGRPLCQRRNIWVERTLCHYKLKTFMWPMKGVYDYWYNHGMWAIILVYFFPTKTIEIMKRSILQPSVLNSVVTFVLGSVRCCWALCFYELQLILPSLYL